MKAVQPQGRRAMIVDRRVLVIGLPRTGSTTLARVLGCHPEINCVLEPFHPNRFGGSFNKLALEAGTVRPALNLLWHRWNLIKHVWETGDGWPFRGAYHLNNELVLGASQVIMIRRRNLLQRYISGVISKRMNFWIGTRAEFLERLAVAQLPELSPAFVKAELDRDRLAIDEQIRFIENSGVPHLEIIYEEQFRQGNTLEEQMSLFNRLFENLGVKQLENTLFSSQISPLLEASNYKWASNETYRAIPLIDVIEREIGCQETGWLFK